jgi:deoxyribodipyrimidine photolyase-related protein
LELIAISSEISLVAMDRTPEPISVWILADQLSHEDNTALRRAPPDAPVVMIESMLLARRLPHSKVRLVLLWSAMRHFAKELRRQGRSVDYHALSPEPGPGDDLTLVDALRDHVGNHGTKRLLVMTPADWAMSDYARRAGRELGIEVEQTPNGLFLSHRGPPRPGEKPDVPGSPELLACTLRRRYGVLVTDKGEPEGGQWHFEPEGRRPEPGDLSPLPRTPPDEITREVVALVEDRFADRVGDLGGFALPVCRADALSWLDDFIEHRLPIWARFQDSVLAGRSTVASAALSSSLNLGLLSPLEVVARAERAYRDGAAPLPAVSGFIRQIMGWREFVHAFHWATMPRRREPNFFEAQRPLPRLFWTGETRCACLADVLRRALDTGHANHTERLMILGNSLLLLGVEPREACDWFHAVFADAWDWCVEPNVLGLALWADGGAVAPKPYAASANYISKVSDHCSKCTYDHTRREGEDACPFNFLYWNFMDRHRRRLSDTPRMKRALEFLEQRSAKDLAGCARESERFLAEIGLG